MAADRRKTRMLWRASVIGALGVVMSWAGSAAAATDPSSPAVVRDGTPSTTFVGKGFDTCSAPDDSQMDAWLQSPYRAVGIYLGGLRYAAGCRAQNSAVLTPAWVRRQAAHGWRFLPIYVGSQAQYTLSAETPAAGVEKQGSPAKPGKLRKPANPGKPRALGKPGTPAKHASKAAAGDRANTQAKTASDFDALNVDTAFQLGVAEADDAVRLARALGFAAPAVITADMESYDHRYTDRVLAYSRGWTTELHRSGFRAGWYSSAGSGIADQVSAYGEDSPDVVDFADWDDGDTVDASTIQNDQWRHHQRVHQTSGGHDETWGGVTLDVDDDVIDVGAASRTSVERVAGADRDGTAIAASRRMFGCAGCGGSDHDQATAAVLARDDGFADALSGSTLAAQVGGPLLLSRSTTVSPAILREVRRVLPHGATVYLLGGTSALSIRVERAVAAAGFVPRRVGGRDRFETAAGVARVITNGRPPSNVLVVSGTDAPDALVAAAAAGSLGLRSGTTPDSGDDGTRGSVMLLTRGTRLTAAGTAYLSRLDPRVTKIYAVGADADAAVDAVRSTDDPRSRTGGPTHISLAGTDHSATAALVAKALYTLPSAVTVADADDWPDALTAAVLASRTGAPLVFTRPDSLPGTTIGFLTDRRNPITGAVVVGGAARVGPASVTALKSALGNGDGDS